ncbi:hypothetical protein Agub_g7535, partial [Astrephomene gubernaculifera]
AGGAPPLDWSLLLRLAAQGRFGRSLPLDEQVFIVVADSVMKQLDGLKSLPDTRVAVRRFMSEGLEQSGPAGYDFLTVLGAHEGEGLALAPSHGGLLGLAGSRSPWLASRGQAVDVRIVEVALFFQAEVARAYQKGNGNGNGEGAAASGSTANAGSTTPFLPVILLSNDNAQIAAAKSHGLPAFRLSSASDLSSRLAAVEAGGGPLTAGLLRSLLAPQATKALGTTATRSIQDQFDSAVGTLRGVVGALGGIIAPLERVRQLAEEGAAGAGAGAEGGDGGGGGPDAAGGKAAEVLKAAVAAFQEISEVLGASDNDTSDHSSSSINGGLLPGLRAVLAGLEGQLVEWEGVVRSRQAPSRLVQWAALGGGGAGV